MEQFKKGFKVGIPIGLGYFAVAFSLGIIAAGAGLNPFQGFLTSLLVHASAGENAAFIAIKESVPYIQMVMVSIVANIRYVLMSFALSQKIDPKTSMIHRLILGFFLTDEFFALAIDQDPYCDPYYSYGAISFAAPAWALGTAMGILMGNILPARIVSALSVALFGMFLAIIIPPAKKSRPIAILIILSFTSSYILSRFTNLSSSIATIILTIIISSLGALLFPVKERDENE
ncbi:MAG: AzlC family ABC transporter permease [Erysipelotrichaceae bacterium]|nr:AzlC family ABC transporter permease [Erysipelotrichaceae bacterium]